MTLVLSWVADGVLIVTLMALALKAAPRLGAATRYCLWWMGLAAVLLLPTVHLLSSGSRAGASEHRPVSTSGDEGTAALAIRVTDAAQPAARAAVLFAALLVSWRLAQLGAAFVSLRRLRDRCRPLPCDLERRLDARLSGRVRGRVARLKVSPDVDGPVVLGGDIPVIALPQWAVDQLDEETLGLLILHEQAHVVRLDDQDLLVQASIEALFAWHPAVWWIGRRLRDERERACDDWVLQQTRQPMEYARCLVRIVGDRDLATASRLVSAIGSNGRQLTGRLERVLAWTPGRHAALRVPALAAGGVALAALVAASAMAGARVRVANVDSGEALNADAQPVVTYLPGATFRTVAVRPTSVRSSTAESTGLRRNEGQSAVVRQADAPRPDVQRPDVQSDDAPRAIAPIEAAVPVLASEPAILLAEHKTPAAEASRDVAADDPSAWARVAGVGNAIGQAGGQAGVTIGLGAGEAGQSIGRGAARAGESIGRSAANAGVKTAGFFSRIGRAIARPF